MHNHSFSTGLTACLAGLLLAGCASAPGGSGSTPELAGTRWTITRVDGGSPLGAEDLTAQFGINGQLEGNSGCNHFSGPWIQSGNTLRVGELLSTRRACAEDDRQQQESRVLRILQGTTTVRRGKDGHLSLTGSSGALELAPLSSIAGGTTSSVPRTRRAMYDCDGVALTVVFEGESAAITWSGGHDVLTGRDTASGYSYASERNTVRSGRSADTLTWTQEGRPPRSCEGLR
ncbi:MAG TPA: META domain-containing protein [Steroidobacteraceae bacterium]|nr:META domain-containing protein [Steroidobacteraceae bacterium]